MSNFIRDVSARSRDIPLNGLPAVYEDYTYPSDTTNNYEEPGSTSHIFNQQPIQQVDSYYNNLYRHTIERLRTCTETWNDYHNSNAVPFYIQQPVTARINDDTLHMRINSEDSNTFVPDASTFVVEDHIMNDKDLVNSNEVTTTKRFTYRLNFNPYMNNTEYLEAMHKGHTLKFINGTIHIVSSYAVEPVDENDEGTLDTLTSLKTDVMDFDINKAIKVSKFNDNFLIDIAPTVAQEEDLKVKADTPLDLGTIVDTGIPCTQEELWKRDIIAPFLFFVDGHPISWHNVVFTTDKRDTYVTFVIRGENFKNVVSNDPYIRCIGFPFPVYYLTPYHWADSKIQGKYDLFCWKGFDDNMSDHIFPSSNQREASSNYLLYAIYPVHDNVYVEDFEVKFDALRKSNVTMNPLYYNYKFSMNNLPYENKIKRSNVFSFFYSKDCKPNQSARGVIAQFDDIDTVDLKWHPFNHVNIKVKSDTIDYIERYNRQNSISINGMYFRAFYNKKVVYDQDNVMRLWNKTIVNRDYEKYVDSLESNIKLFIDRIYDLAQDPVWQIHMDIMHFDNMEEGSTPTDEFVWYSNYETKVKLHEIADEMFSTDTQIIKDTISSIIDEAFVAEFNPEALDEWCLRKNLPEMFVYGDNMDLIINNIGLLEEVFDFKYRDYNNYFRDLYEATDYIISYDPDKLENTIIHPTFSYTKNGVEMQSMIYLDETYGSTLRVPMVNSGTRESHLMLFKNGLLYSKYNTIREDGFNIYFEMNRIEDCPSSENDIWEFVWFRNVNNDVYSAHYYENSTDEFATMYTSAGNIETKRTGYKVIGCNTSVFDPEDLMVMTNIIDTNPYKERIKQNTDAQFTVTKYPLYYRLYSYEAHHENPTHNHYGVFKYLEDYKLNGLHRITRQGGGEYFIQPLKSTYLNSRSTIHSSSDPNPDRMAEYKARPGLGSHCFAFCPNMDDDETVFTGNAHEIFQIAKDNSWFYGTNITHILCAGANPPIYYAVHKEEE